MVFGQSEEEKKEKERKKDPSQWMELEKIDNTEMYHAGDFLMWVAQGAIDIKTVWLPEPYLFLYDPNFGFGPGKSHNLAKAVNLIAKFRGYRVVSHMVASEGRSPHYVCMVKE